MEQKCAAAAAAYQEIHQHIAYVLLLLTVVVMFAAVLVVRADKMHCVIEELVNLLCYVGLAVTLTDVCALKAAEVA